MTQLTAERAAANLGPFLRNIPSSIDGVRLGGVARAAAVPSRRRARRSLFECLKLLPLREDEYSKSSWGCSLNHRFTPHERKRYPITLHHEKNTDLASVILNFHTSLECYSITSVRMLTLAQFGK